MEVSLAEYKITGTLIAVHWVPLLFSAWLWPLKHLSVSISSAITFLFSIAAWLIVLVCLVLFFDVKPEGRSMTWFAAYLIYALMSFGIIPLAIIAVHVFAGRSAGLVLASWLRKNRPNPVM